MNSLNSWAAATILMKLTFKTLKLAISFSISWVIIGVI